MKTNNNRLGLVKLLKSYDIIHSSFRFQKFTFSTQLHLDYINKHEKKLFNLHNYPT